MKILFIFGSLLLTACGVESTQDDDFSSEAIKKRFGNKGSAECSEELEWMFECARRMQLRSFPWKVFGQLTRTVVRKAQEWGVEEVLSRLNDPKTEQPPGALLIKVKSQEDLDEWSQTLSAQQLKEVPSLTIISTDNKLLYVEPKVIRNLLGIQGNSRAQFPADLTLCNVLLKTPEDGSIRSRFPSSIAIELSQCRQYRGTIADATMEDSAGLFAGLSAKTFQLWYDPGLLKTDCQETDYRDLGPQTDYRNMVYGFGGGLALASYFQKSGIHWLHNNSIIELLFEEANFTSDGIIAHALEQVEEILGHQQPNRAGPREPMLPEEETKDETR